MLECDAIVMQWVREIYVQNTSSEGAMPSMERSQIRALPSWTDLPEREGAPTFAAVEGDGRLPLRLSREVSVRRGLFQAGDLLLPLPALDAEPAEPDDEVLVARADCFLLLACFLTGDGDGDIGSSTSLSSIRES